MIYRGGKLLLAIAVLASSVFAQWINYPSPKTPHTRDGKPDLAAKAPRTRDGKPDLSGLWHIEPTSKAEMKRLFGDDVPKWVPALSIASKGVGITAIWVH